jgi:hypothetical protein
MNFRSSASRGRIDIPINAAIVGYRLVPDMPVGDALEAYAVAESMNDRAEEARRDPAWSAADEHDLRFQGDPEWTNEQISFAREVLTRALRAFGDAGAPQVTQLRSDGRYEVADHEMARGFYCPVDDWCILECGHPGTCNDDREAWFGPDTLYPPRELSVV